MAGNTELYEQGIVNKHPTYSVAVVQTGTTYIATATVTIGGAFVAQSRVSGSSYAASLDLWERLNNGQIGLPPTLTTTQAEALTGIDDGVEIINSTRSRMEVSIGGVFRDTTRRFTVSGITASTTQTQGNGVLTGDLNVIATVANSMDVITLPTATEGIICIVFNNGTKMLQIFPNTSDDLGEGVNTATTLKKGSVKVFYAYSDTYWLHYGDFSDDDAAVAAYGGMYEDNSSGTGISATTSYVGWVSATTGVIDGNSIVTFTGNATADRLTIGTDGAGDYEVTFHASVTNSGGKITTGAIHVNGVEQVAVKMALQGDSSKPVALGASSPLTLADNDYIDLRFKSEASDTVTVYHVNVHVERVS